MESRRAFRTRAVGVAIPLGAGVGGVFWMLWAGYVGDDVGRGLAFGAGTGVAIGFVLVAAASWLVGRFGERTGLLATIPAGALVGGGFGLVWAWSADAGYPFGLLFGGAAGLTLGVLLAGVLYAQLT